MRKIFNTLLPEKEHKKLSIVPGQGWIGLDNFEQGDQNGSLTKK